MDIDQIIDTQNRSAAAIIADLKSKTIYVPSWASLLPEYDARQHPVMNKNLYRDKVMKNGSVEKVTRITLPLQRLAVKRMSELLFAIPVKRIYHPQTDEEQTAARIIESIYKRNRINSVNIMRARALYAACETVTLWYTQEQDVYYAGELSPIKIRCKVFSPMTGDILYPLFDEYDDLKALSIEYSRTDGQTTTRYFDVYTNNRHLRFRGDANSKNMDLEVDEVITIGKITGVYMHRPEPIWEDQSENVYEAEWTLSRNGNYIRKNARPNWVVFSDKSVQHGKEASGDNEGRNVLQYPSDAKAEYVTWQQATDSIKFHIEEIKRNFFMSLQLPNMSMDEMKSTPMSGEARKMLFIDCQLKASDEAGIWYEALDRETNIIRSLVGAIFPDLADATKTLSIENVITPYNIRDEQERIDVISKAAGNKQILSVRTAVEKLGYNENIDEEIERIEDENTGDIMTQSYE